MGVYLNPGNEAFRLATNSEIYVDKSLMIAECNKVINTEHRFVAVSRPRRFGKSMAANMLVAYYDLSCDSNDIFKELKIYKDDSYEVYRNKYNVIKINMQEFLSEASDIAELIAMVETAVSYEVKKLMDIPEHIKSLARILSYMYSENGAKFVFVIDEWDCVMRESKHSTEEQKLYLDFLRNLLKDKTYVALAYMTGILPIKKYGTHSALNMFDEYSMVNPGAYSEYVGFTEYEVCYYCDKYGVDSELMKRWYNGYSFAEGQKIYNPRAVVSALTSKIFTSYWTQTETYEALRIYFDLNLDGLKDKIIHMLGGEAVQIDVGGFQNDMVTFECADDVLTLLVHLGYVSYDIDKKSVRIPNEEIQSEFYRSVIRTKEWSDVIDALEKSQKLLEATWNMDSEAVAQAVDDIHMDTASILQYNDENSLACTLSIAYYNAVNYYTRIRELPTGKGFADIVFLPKKETDRPALVLELKYDKDADSAINQIKEKKYTAGIKKYQGDMLLVGINYNKNTKKHECVIEKYQK